MKSFHPNNAEFILSAVRKDQFIHSSVPGIVFAGKSNVGKSSAINMLVNRKSFAKVGNTPGKTVHINYFLIDKKVYFIDLPGYGFANVAKQEKERWSILMEEFFAEPGLFSLGFLIVDARHSPTLDDIGMFNWFRNSGVRFIVLANKVDKLKKSEIEPQLETIRSAFQMRDSELLLPFSAEKGIGRNEVLHFITEA